jgi:NAD(P)-dependent dehydrogenase (short-subunit alcohol dehydrogenase family)
MFIAPVREGPLWDRVEKTNGCLVRRLSADNLDVKDSLAGQLRFPERIDTRSPEDYGPNKQLFLLWKGTEVAGRLEGKVAIITGGGSGMGEATAKLFHKEGARVVLVDISGQQEDVAKALGDGALAVHGDVSKAADVQAMVETTVSTFGRLDVLYNNAGIDGALAPTGEYSEEDWDQVIGVNLKGAFLGMRYGIPAMVKSGGGSIISTSSMAANVAFASMPGYCASKAGIVMLTKTAAVEYAKDGIRVNAILPGVIDTGMSRSLPTDLIQGIKQATPAGRIADASEIATVALFLASDDSSFITGAEIVVDGGYTLV